MNMMKLMIKRTSSTYPYHTYVIALFICAFLVRMLIALSINMPLVSDDADYHAIGIALSEGKGFILENQLTASRPPGYPVFLSVCYWIFGPSSLSVRCAQACVDLLSCLLLFLIARNVFSQRIAFIATSILAFFPLHLLYIPRISTEIVFTSLLLLNVWLMIRPWRENQAFLSIVLIGLAIGVATLVRPIGGILILAAIWFCWNRTVPTRTNVLCTATLLGSFMLILLPWLVRNQVVFGHYALTSNLGLNLWIGNNPQANGSYSFYKADNPLALEKDEFKQSDLGFRLACDYVIHHPFSYPLLLAKKTAHFFSSDYSLMIFLQYNPEWSHYPRAALIYGKLSIPLWILLHFPYVVVVFFGILGLVCPANGQIRSAWFILFVTLSFFIVHLVFFSGARFRMPVMPLFILFAASGWHEWIKGTMRFQGWRRVTSIILFAMMLAIWIAEYVTLQIKLQQ